MKDLINDVIKLGTEVSKLTEKRLNSLASKLAKSKDITQKEAKKIVAKSIKRVAKTQRVLANDIAKNAKKASKKGYVLKKLKAGIKKLSKD